MFGVVVASAIASPCFHSARPVRVLPPFPRLVGGGFVGSALSVVSGLLLLRSAVASSLHSRGLLPPAFVLRGSSRVLWLHTFSLCRVVSRLSLRLRPACQSGVPALRLQSSCLSSCLLSFGYDSDPSDLSKC